MTKQILKLSLCAVALSGFVLAAHASTPEAASVDTAASVTEVGSATPGLIRLSGSRGPG